MGLHNKSTKKSRSIQKGFCDILIFGHTCLFCLFSCLDHLRDWARQENSIVCEESRVDPDIPGRTIKEYQLTVESLGINYYGKSHNTESLQAIITRFTNDQGAGPERRGVESHAIGSIKTSGPKNYQKITISNAFWSCFS